MLAYLYTLGAANGLMLSVLLFATAKHSGPNRVMALWCLLLSLGFLGNLLHMQEQLTPFSCLVGWSYYLPSAYGGLLFLYCQKLLHGSSFKATDLVHLLPLLLCYTLNIDILLAASEQKLIYIQTSPPQTPSFFITQFILFAQAFIYGFFAIKEIVKYKQQFKQQFSTTYKELLYWMRILIILSMLIWLAKLLPTLLGDFYWLSGVGTVLIVLLIYCVGFMQWYKPHLFVTVHLHTIKINTQSAAPKETEPVTLHSRPNNTALEIQTRATFAKVLIDAISEQDLYLQENLSLADMSKYTDISAHHISETLNQHLNKNFYRFINEYRVAHFCERLAENTQTTITDLALQSGFANKSTFNAAFKEIMQQTPSEYRKSMRMTKPTHTSKSI